MIDKRYMIDCLYKQLAIDYNCNPEDFQTERVIFTEAKMNEGRRPYPFITPRLEVITMGKGIIINASGDVLPYIRKEFEGKTEWDVFNSPLIYGVNTYFLPDIEKITPLKIISEYKYEIIEKHKIHELYKFEDFRFVLQYDTNSLFSEMLVVIAKHKGNVIGMAGANCDCKTMCSINVDVLPLYRGKGLASVLVNMLTLEVLNRGYIPYYFTSPTNIFSMRVAVKSGYIPAWWHSYKARFDSINFID